MPAPPPPSNPPAKADDSASGPAPAPQILLVEDNVDIATMIREILGDHFESDTVHHVTLLEESLGLDLDVFDLVLQDLNLPDGSGLDALAEMLARRPDLPVVMITSESALDFATEAIRRGAYDYVVKAGDYLFTIPLIVEKNLAVWKIKQRNFELRQELEETLNSLRDKNHMLNDVVAQLENQATTDSLTGIANRRHIQQSLEQAFAQASRHGHDLACLMIDLDGFKGLNDTLGHQAGDKILQAVGHCLRANCRGADIFGRYGGDEFVVLMPETDFEGARCVAKRMRDYFRHTTLAMYPDQAEVDMSIGIATVVADGATSGEKLMALADAAMYQTKEARKANPDPGVIAG